MLPSTLSTIEILRGLAALILLVVAINSLQEARRDLRSLKEMHLNGRRLMVAWRYIRRALIDVAGAMILLRQCVVSAQLPGGPDGDEVSAFWCIYTVLRIYDSSDAMQVRHKLIRSWRYQRTSKPAERGELTRDDPPS